MTILLVDDEDSVQKLLTYPLERDGFRVVHALDGEEALARFAEEDIDLVVLDLMLPKLDGLEVCKRLRAESSVPIIMLTARDDELDKVLGLELGADDYITKPFSIREFRSRVKALLRRAAAPRPGERNDDEVIEQGELRIDVPRRTVEVRGQEVQLTFVEFELLRVLASAPGRVFSRRQLLEKLRGGADYREPRTIDVHVRHLREKIEADPHEPELILTVRGVGYRFQRALMTRPTDQGHPAAAGAGAAARGRRRARRRLPDRRALARGGARERQARPARGGREDAWRAAGRRSTSEQPQQFAEVASSVVQARVVIYTAIGEPLFSQADSNHDLVARRRARSGRNARRRDRQAAARHGRARTAAGSPRWRSSRTRPGP